MRHILNVAEKHDVAKIISNTLSKNECSRKMIVNEQYKFFQYDFVAQELFPNSNMVFTHVAGHLMTIDFPPECNDWFKTPYENLFTSPLQVKPTPCFVGIINAIKKLSRSCNQLIIWTDCDREGERIGFEIIDICRSVNRNILVSRAKFSDLNERSLFNACRNLIPPNLEMSQAVEARQELDLRIGCVFTRMQSTFLKQSIEQLSQQRVISYGPCQFPTLGFIVDRYNEIKNFIPETFWKIVLKHMKNGLNVGFEWDRNRLFDKNAVQVLFEGCQDDPEAIVVDVTKKPKSKYRPQPLYTVEFERLATRYLKMSAKEAMTIAEKLYSQGFISYPRTETNMFAPSANLTEYVQNQLADPRWGGFAQKVLSSGPKPRNGTKTDNAHPPIHPIKPGANLGLITRHFLATCSFDGAGQETKISVKLGTESVYIFCQQFKCTGLLITDRGYLEVYPYDKWSDHMDPGETTPPSLLTEADLISLMEKYQIGTDATHAEHIETIQKREYTYLVDGHFLPTCLGMGLIEGIYQHQTIILNFKIHLFFTRISVFIDRSTKK
ncbi:DNA topoisomerase 3-alpha [Thelohanellus kitauei]|uniref:DNA topoisomerase n=1 Tax=Thelohanellus kitauei TaxID=669202 RepID=A0A0C2MH44_THEKT|nr:DNA topoisomerase 3-alpha [Thelohanellus kitauei]